VADSARPPHRYGGYYYCGYGLNCHAPPGLSPRGAPEPQPANVEQKLSNANIILSEGDISQVRKWLNTDPAYQALAQACLDLVGDRRVIHPIPLDVINYKYKRLHDPVPDDHLSPDKYRDIEKLKRAIFETWKERHTEASQNSFDTIVESIPKGS
jgi:hypothetical protein